MTLRSGAVTSAKTGGFVALDNNSDVADCCCGRRPFRHPSLAHPPLSAQADCPNWLQTVLRSHCFSVLRYTTPFETDLDSQLARTRVDGPTMDVGRVSCRNNSQQQQPNRCPAQRTRRLRPARTGFLPSVLKMSIYDFV